MQQGPAVPRSSMFSGLNSPLNNASKGPTFQADTGLRPGHGNSYAMAPSSSSNQVDAFADLASALSTDTSGYSPPAILTTAVASSPPQQNNKMTVNQRSGSGFSFI